VEAFNAAIKAQTDVLSACSLDKNTFEWVKTNQF
jgi:hypothetical protein